MLRRSIRIAVAALAAGLLLAPTAAPAQESQPEEGDIGPGTAKATAMVARIGPGVGDLELAIRAGLAVTQITNRIAQSTGQTLDLGLIGTSLTAETCDDAILSPDQLPQPTDIDNREGDARLTEHEGGTADAPVSIGHKDVEAGTEPVSARATTTPARLDLPGVIRLNGGQAESITEVLPGAGRQATATVNASLSIGPLTLSGLEWRAFHRTGAEPHAEASFRIASIAGSDLIDIPLDNLHQTEEVVNGLLATLGTGVTIEFPRVERFLEPTDLIRVTPLRISIRDSPLGGTLLSPLRVATQDVQNTLFQTLTEAICETAAVLLVGDIALSVIAGTGFLTLEVGGAEASSSRFVITNPFGAPVPPNPPATTDPLPPPSPAPQISTAPVAPVTSPPSSEVAAPPTQPSASTGPLEDFCASVHPNGGSCEEGAALALGLLGVLVTIAVAGYEVRKQWPGSGGDA